MLLLNVTPQAFSHQTCLPKYMTMTIGPGFLQPKSWLLRHHDWTLSYIEWKQMCTYQDIDDTIVRVVRQSLLILIVPYWAPCSPCLFLWVCGSWFEWIYSYTTSFVSSNNWACSQDLMRGPWACFPWACWVFVFIWVTCNLTNYSLVSLNVTITHPITLYLLEQYSIPLKPVLGGVIIVALSISSHEQTQ